MSQSQSSLLQITRDLPADASKIIEEIFQRHPTFQDDPEASVKLWLDFVHSGLPRIKTRLDIDSLDNLFNFIYKTRKVDVDGPPVIWRPSPRVIAESNINQLMRSKGFKSYRDLHKWSITQREQFWKHIIEKLGIVFNQHPQQISGSTDPEKPHWLQGAKLNIVESCFTAPPNQPAVLYREENEVGVLHTWTYAGLRALTNRVSNGLVEAGFQVGDPIAIDMPMTIESVAIYLGIIQAGMVVVSIADSFSPPEIEKRLRISKAKGIFTVEGYMRGGKRINIYTKVLAAHPPRTIVISITPTQKVKHLREGDLDWTKFLSKKTTFQPHYANPNDHTNILFSSGTTGDPKAIPWSQTTPIKACMDGYYHHDIKAGDVVCWPTNVGWMMGPWLIYQLINRSTLALFYGAPSGEQFGRFIEDAGVTMLGTIPTMVKTWAQSRCMEGCDWSNIRCFSSTGECSHPVEVLYLMSLTNFQAPLIEYCGGTEIGGGYISSTVVQEHALSAFTTPCLGVDFVVLDPDNKIVSPGNHGEVYLSPPSIGLSEIVLNRDHHKEYFLACPKDPRTGGVLRRHGDQMGVLGGGYYQALGRADDTMNLGGIKVGSAELERCMAHHPLVLEVAAIGIQGVGGQTDLVAFVVFKPNVQLLPQVVQPKEGETAAAAAAAAAASKATTPVQSTTATQQQGAGAITLKQLKSELQQLLRKEMNPLFKLSDITVVPNLPKTINNKILRRNMRDDYMKQAKQKQTEQAHKIKSKL